MASSAPARGRSEDVVFTTTASRFMEATPYRVDGRLAQGGMGWVFHGQHVELGHRVAIKLLDEAHREDPGERGRLVREARLAARVDSEHVVRVLDAGTTRAGDVFYVMDYVGGETLDDELSRRGRFSASDARRVGARIALGLADTHAAGVVHRDIKLDNILLGRRQNGAEHCVIIDFGIAASIDEPRGADASGLVWGTPRFMAPEQACGLAVGPAADVYALGVVLYALISGRLPFDAADARLVMRAHIRTLPPRLAAHAPHCPRDLAELVHRCLEKRPQDRPTALEAAVELMDMESSDAPQRIEGWGSRRASSAA